MKVELSIVVPAYNEAQRLPRTLECIGQYLRRARLRHEVIVVDDGSTDATGQVVRALAAGWPGLRLLSLSQNRGKGAAVREGVLAARGDLVLFTDADLSTPIGELERLRAQLAAGFDVAVGSRAVAGDVVRRQPRLRKLAGRIFRLAAVLLGYRALAKIRDSQCGFKLFRREVARTLFSRLHIDGFAFDVELLDLACRHHRVAEVAVTWEHVAGSKVSLLRESVRMLRDLARVRLFRLLGRRPRLMTHDVQVIGRRARRQDEATPAPSSVVCAATTVRPDERKSLRTPLAAGVASRRIP